MLLQEKLDTRCSLDRDLPAYAAKPAPSPARAGSVSAELVRMLEALGVEMAFGVVGGAISQLCHALEQSSIAYLHFRHETGAAFAALEASLATNKPVVVFTTSGPGLTNALTGISAARWDGGRVILISASSSPAHRGRVATQETHAGTLPSSGLFLSGPPFHYATSIEHPAQLDVVVAELARGLRRQDGFIAHVSLPIALQGERAPRPTRLPLEPALPPTCAPEIGEAYAELLAGKRFVIWLGFGARHAAAEIVAFAERTGARVIASPRAKGIFPEDHPLYLGVTGLGGDSDVDEKLGADPPDYMLVLGTKMGESTSFWAKELCPKVAFIHVDVNPQVFGAAYPEARTYGVEADVGAFIVALGAALRDASKPRPSGAKRPRPEAPPLRDEGPVRPQIVLDALQHVVVDQSSAVLMAESGNSFCWSTNLLRFRTPGRYRVSTGFGSMGHAATGVVGAALARHDKAVALLGDGAMLMQSEVHSAVQYGAKAVWVILNDACYLMCEQGMKVLGWEPFGTRMNRVDFVALARALGADGERVTRERDMEGALRRAMASERPFVLDIHTDPREMAPSGKRHKNLMQQGHDAKS